MAYDLLSAIDILFPGLVVQRSLWDAAEARFVSKGSPLDSTDVTPILAVVNTFDQDGAGYMPSGPGVYPLALPTYPTSMPRFPDSNPPPDGWSIMGNGPVVFGAGTV
jgi:hypothetical protein